MKLSSHQITNLLSDYYQNNFLIKECCLKYKISKSSVIKILKLFGSGGRKRKDYNNNKYTCNESFFSEIDCHEKAYWYGFICADGNIYNNKLQIGLDKADENHLLKFCKRLNYNGPIYNDGTCKKLIISRKNLVDDLKKLGLVENKTALIDENIFIKIPSQYLKSAILGYIDGDGCFSRKLNGIEFSLLGNFSFLNFIIDFFGKQNVLVKEPKKDKRTKHTFYINKFFPLERACDIIDILYSDGSEDFLERKREKLIYERQPASI